MLKNASINLRVHPDPAVQTAFSVTALNQTTRTADNATYRQADAIGIGKDMFYSIINYKNSTAYRTLGFTVAGFDTLIQAEWAG